MLCMLLRQRQRLQSKVQYRLLSTGMLPGLRRGADCILEQPSKKTAFRYLVDGRETRGQLLKAQALCCRKVLFPGHVHAGKFRAGRKRYGRDLIPADGREGACLKLEVDDPCSRDVK